MKLLTPLEALKILKENNKCSKKYKLANYMCIEIIEEALKGYEKVKEEKEALEYEKLGAFIYSNHKYRKQLEALEIFKKCCLLSKTELAFTNKIEITEEEYELLSEVLDDKDN